MGPGVVISPTCSISVLWGVGLIQGGGVGKALRLRTGAGPGPDRGQTDQRGYHLGAAALG